MTALGHSYGSLTTGIALQQRTGVNDAVFFGSPGISDKPDLPVSPVGLSNELADLKLPGGHAYTLEADGDAVADVGNLTGRFGSDPGSMPNMHHLSTGNATSQDGAHLVESTGHGEYLKVLQDGTSSTSKYNISAVVSGVEPKYMVWEK